MQRLLTVIGFLFALPLSAQGQCVGLGGYTTDGDETPCGNPDFPYCTVLGACNGPNTPCCNYDPDFSATGGCDLSCVGVCYDEEACNYGIAEECWYAEAGFHCEGYCLVDSDGDGELESEVCCESIGLEFWGDVEGGIHPAENSVVQGIQVEVEFVLNIPGTLQDSATGTPYAVSQFVIEEVTSWPSWADVTELEGDTLEALEQTCIPISGIPVSEGTYEIAISGTYTVLIFDLPFEIGAVEYSVVINVEENPDPVEGCTYEFAINFLPYATVDDGSCEFEGCADETALNYIPYGNSFDVCLYAEDVCSTGLVWDDQLLTCVPAEEFVEELQMNACGEGTAWSAELNVCLPVNSCPQDLNGDGIIGVNDLLEILSGFGIPCDPLVAEWTCGDSVSYHGYDYATVQIGEQCWFAENLRAAVYANGDSIQGQLSTTEWLNTNEGAQAIYGNIPAYLESRGRLYNWFAINDNRNVCPFGWHVPSDTEFKDLEMILGMSESESNSEGWRGTDQGQQMKSSNWGSGSNSSGFTAIASGYRRTDGLFVAINDYTGFWSSTSNGTELAWNRQLYGGWTEVYRGGSESENNNGYSVRCLKD